MTIRAYQDMDSIDAGRLCDMHSIAPSFGCGDGSIPSGGVACASRGVVALGLRETVTPIRLPPVEPIPSEMFLG